MKFLIPLLLVSFLGCVKEYSIPGVKYNEMLVIDGMLTDQDMAVVKVSHSYKTEAVSVQRASGAEVTIVDSDGQVYALQEEKNNEGTYMSELGMMHTQHGKTYQLVVKYNGTTYQSSEEEMLAVPKIDSASFTYSDDKNGIWITVSTTGQDIDSKYFTWSLDETWKITTSYVSTRQIHVLTCFTGQTTGGILLSNTASLSHNILNDEQIYFIPFSTNRLAVRYSALINMYSITRDTYLYLEHVKKTNESNGGLFDPIPSSMNGNIVSSDGGSPVVGNFQASSVSSHRIFIDRQDLDRNIMIDWGGHNCLLEEYSIYEKKRTDSLLALSWSIMDTVGSDEFKIRISNMEQCFNCIATGASSIPPVWWIDRKY